MCGAALSISSVGRTNTHRSGQHAHVHTTHVSCRPSTRNMIRNVYVDSAGLRKDGRRPGEVRRIRYKLGTVQHADGSTYYEQGLTRVLATVYGPQETKMKNKPSATERAFLTCEFRPTPFSSSDAKSKKYMIDSKSMQLAKTVKQTFETVLLTKSFPKSEIKIVLHGIQSDGGMICACINATTLALVDAGIPMKDLVAACSAGRFGDVFVTDLNYAEEFARKPNLPVAILSRTDEIVMVQLKSKVAAVIFSRFLYSLLTILFFPFCKS